MYYLRSKFDGFQKLNTFYGFETKLQVLVEELTSWKLSLWSKKLSQSTSTTVYCALAVGSTRTFAVVVPFELQKL